MEMLRDLDLYIYIYISYDRICILIYFRSIQSWVLDLVMGLDEFISILKAMKQYGF